MKAIGGCFGFGLILVSAILVWTSCGQASNANAGYDFYYYPAHNLYYDVAKTSFIYTVDGGKNWNYYKSDTSRMPETLGNRIAFNSPVPNAWVNNKEHRIHYNGAASDYIGSGITPLSTHPQVKTTVAVTSKKEAVKKKEDPNWGKKDKEKGKKRDKDRHEKKDKERADERFLKDLEKQFKRLKDKVEKEGSRE